MKLSFVMIALAFGLGTVVAAPIPHSSDVAAHEVEESHEHDHSHNHQGSEHEHDSHAGSTPSHHVSRRELVYDILQARYPNNYFKNHPGPPSAPPARRALVEDILREREISESVKAMAAKKLTEAVTNSLSPHGASNVPPPHPDSHGASSTPTGGHTGK